METLIRIESQLRSSRISQQSYIRIVKAVVGTIISAFLQAYTILVFVRPSGLISSGFTGLALLVDSLTSGIGIHIPTYLGMVLFNAPLVIFAWKNISKRFVFFSCLQVILASAFLQIPQAHLLLEDNLLRVVFGGVLYGISIAIALRSGSSTAGTDFLSLMYMSKTGKNAWGYVFAFNCSLIAIFALQRGWSAAAYSIIFQFLSTKTIESAYHRFERMTVQIVTEHADAVLKAYNSTFRHGSSIAKVRGGYGGKAYTLITTVVSSYEIEDIKRCILDVDEHAVMNVMRCEDFVGGFYRGDW